MKAELNKEQGESNSFYVTKRAVQKIYDLHEDYDGTYTEARKKGIKLPREKYSPETKIIVAKYAKNHISKLAADRYSIPVGTIRRWLSLYNRLGNSAFYEQKEVLPDLYNGVKQEYDECSMTPRSIPKLDGETSSSYRAEAEEIHKRREQERKLDEGFETDDFFQTDDISNSAQNITKTHIRLNTADSKLPDVEGWEKVNLISPSLRLWAAQEGIKAGKRETAAKVGVNISTLNRWMFAYKTMGEEAHLFKQNRRYYSGAENGGQRKGVCIYSTEFKKQIIDRALKESGYKVAYEIGISPDTITKWKKKLSYPRVVGDKNIQVPSWYNNPKWNRAQQESPVIERFTGERWELFDGSPHSPSHTLHAATPDENLVDAVYLD